VIFLSLLLLVFATSCGSLNLNSDLQYVEAETYEFNEDIIWTCVEGDGIPVGRIGSYRYTDVISFLFVEY